MTPDWQSPEQANSIERYENDPRPVWLWAEDGDRPVWTNRAAPLFGARLKASGLKRVDKAAPIKGQIARLLRMGLLGHTMPSRMQFLAGRKPLSATCLCTPIHLANRKLHLLVVGIDPIAPEILAAAGIEPETTEAPNHTTPEPPVAEEVALPREEPESESKSDVQNATEIVAEDDGVPTLEGLSALVDKLAGHSQLFDPLDARDDAPLPAPVPGRDYATIAFDEDVEKGNDEGRSDWGDEDPVILDEAAFAADSNSDEAPARAGLWQISGRRLTLPRATYDDQEEETTLPPNNASETAEKVEDDAMERASRYNFEELSRILTDRVGQDSLIEPARREADTPQGGVVAISEEALVLNRLPLGILIFRDQEIIFANRALVDLTGYENATALRELGLAAIFPTIDSGDPAGPVTQLVRSDGQKVAVTARLNAITWQGRPSFMLSARASDIEPLREVEVGEFAALWARLAGFDFVTADRSGLITAFSPGSPDREAPADGTPINGLVAQGDHRSLRHFLSLPARYAGGVRPSVTLKGARAGQTLTLFAEGRAGIISGYFGLIGPLTAQQETPARRSSVPTATLGRITRGLRRPLNTIAGFSELIASESFGPLANARYLEYARDIRSAGSAIADLADELDDYVRLAEGETALSPADVDIATLLAECLVRVRGEAGRERVLLRSGISERLPLARVDAATLKQAVLNMLASAISEAGEGSKVVLSGQVEEDGSVSIHVRDATRAPNQLAERFVVFRDGLAADGTERRPSQSSIGLTLTRSLVAVNACSLSLNPASETGTLMTLTIPASLVVGR